MGDHHGGDDFLRQAARGAIGGIIGAEIAQALRPGYEPGYRNDQQGPNYPPPERYGLPPIELEHRQMQEDSRHAASDLLNSRGNDQRFARAELEHARLVDREYNQHGRFYEDALRTLQRDVRQESGGREDLRINSYGNRTEMSLVPNYRPLYEPRQAPPGNYYYREQQRPQDQYNYNYNTNPYGQFKR